MGYIDAKDYFRDNIVGIQKAIDDCSSDAGVVTISDVDVWHEYVNNGLGYRDTSDGDIWNTTTNIIDVSDRVLYDDIDITLKTTVETNSANSMLHVELYIPDPTGDIHVMGKTVTPSKQNIPHRETITYPAYIGAKAKLYGFKIRTKVDATLSGIFQLTERSILIRI